MREKKVNGTPIGVSFDEKGIARVLLWAPLAKTVSIVINEKTRLALHACEYGYWNLNTVKLLPGDRYVFLLDNKKKFPDPASLFQPDGVHGTSQAVNLNDFKWYDENWHTPKLNDYIIYELHSGTFTREGNFHTIINKLDYLVDLGITAIEIMPVSQFSGERNWGYDGVFPFAVQNSYGGPTGLQLLVNACHEKGIAVILDVVYNHLGPEGNYLPFFGPYFTEKYKTPWGNALNFDDAWCDGVREFFVQNALMWFRDFHIDALRLDAVHAIRDFSPKHILQEIKENAEMLSAATGKQHYLIIECDLNDTRFINPFPEGYGMDAQWTDEFHHALRVSSGQERTGYYADFNGVEDLAKAYNNAYVYNGRYSEQRHKFFGVETNNPGNQFVVFSQNHDHIGNRMLGERTSQLSTTEMQKLLASAVLLSPYIPLLFMGEEWSAPSRFLYFVSHIDEELIAAVQKGRKEEFKEFNNEGEAPDPQAVKTFERSILPWELLEKKQHKTMLQFYKSLIILRKSEPALKNLIRNNINATADIQSNTLTLKRWCGEQELICFMNFSATTQKIRVPQYIEGWQKLFTSVEKNISPSIDGGQDLVLEPESVIIYTMYHV